MDPARTAADRAKQEPFGSRLLGTAELSPRRLRVRVQLILTWLLVTTNLIGAGVVVVISSFVLPQPAPSDATVLSLAIAVPVYVLVAVVLGIAIGTASTLRALRWVTEDRSPTDTDRTNTLRAPLRLTRMQAVLWAGATLLFTLLALVLQPSRAINTLFTVGIAAFVVSAVAYLQAQFALRPIAARALAQAPLTERPRGVGVGDRMVIFWLLGTALPLTGLMIAAVVALAGDQTSLTRLAVVVLVIGSVVLLFGLFITVLNARSVVAPVVSVRDALLAVERGDLDQAVPVYDGTELGQLQSGFNQMVTGLREREHLRDLFGRHVGKDVARAAAEGKVELGGRTIVVSVLFVDLVGSTTYAADHPAQEVVAVLNRFFG
ncbi:HAMP domain-containing protein, partial [Nocardioides sp.]|uniref:HAMP domain-containing protein n=1 Tax=Nocardioides sp. TaxID=35761 RepID=UPI002B273CF2